MIWAGGAGWTGGVGVHERARRRDKRGVVHIAGGRWHMCAALGSGGVACWGTNQSGQLGDGTTESRAAPVLVLGLP